MEDKPNIEIINLAKNLFDLSQEILRIFNKDVEEKDLRPSKIPAYKNTFLYQLNTSIAQFYSIILLCENKKAEPSLIILRSLLENLISMKFILIAQTDKEVILRNERFLEYKCFQMKKLLRYWKESSNVVRKDIQQQVLSKETTILKECESFKQKFGITSNRQLANWSGIPISDMAEKVDMTDEYSLIYTLCCNYTHPSFLGWVQNVKKTPDKTIFSHNTSNQTFLILQQSIIYFYELLFIFNILFELPCEEKLNDFQNKAKIIFNKKKE
jgi:hypothetical protein